MEQKGLGQAGSFESNDLMVIVDLNNDENLKIDINSIVKENFGGLIEKVVKETLCELGITNGNVKIIDKGALDFTIRARVKTAIKRAKGGIRG